jgi:Ni/Co efflux regulator RcnB
MYRILDRKPNRKRQFERCRHRWEKIKQILKKQVWGGGEGGRMDWNHLAQNRDQWQAYSIHSELNKKRQFLVL